MSRQDRERELAEKAVDARMKIMLSEEGYSKWRAEQDAREAALRWPLPRG